MIRFENDRDGYTSSTLSLASMITLGIFAVYCIGSSVLDSYIDLPKCMMIMMFFEIFFSTAMSFWAIRNRFEYKYKSVIVFTLLVAFLGPMISIWLISLASNSMQAEAKVLGMLGIKILFYIFVYIHILRKGKKVFVKEYWLYALAYNLPLIPHYLSQQVLTQADRIMINDICGKSDAAIYGVAYQLAMAAFMFTYAIHNSLGPWTFEKIKKKEYTSINNIAILIELLIGIMCFGFSLVAPELIYILGGEVYIEAVWVVPPIAMSVLFQTIYTFFSYVEFYFEKTKFVMIASIICAISNLFLNAVFIPLYGFAAAGYTTLFCYVLYAWVHYQFMKKIIIKENIDTVYSGKKYGS